MIYSKKVIIFVNRTNWDIFFNFKYLQLFNIIVEIKIKFLTDLLPFKVT